jgi:hypothetical protein
MPGPISTISAAQQDFDVYGGDTFNVVLKFFEDDNTTPINISTYTIAMQIKKSQTSTPLLSFTLGDGLAIGGVGNNELTVSKIILIKGGTYFYDIEITMTDGTVVTYLQGIFNITQDTTNTTGEK